MKRTVGLKNNLAHTARLLVGDTMHPLTLDRRPPNVRLPSAISYCLRGSGGGSAFEIGVRLVAGGDAAGASSAGVIAAGSSCSTRSTLSPERQICASHMSDSTTTGTTRNRIRPCGLATP